VGVKIIRVLVRILIVLKILLGSAIYFKRSRRELSIDVAK